MSTEKCVLVGKIESQANRYSKKPFYILNVDDLDLPIMQTLAHFIPLHCNRHVALSSGAHFESLMFHLL